MTERTLTLLAAIAASFLLTGGALASLESIGYGEHEIEATLQPGDHGAWSFGAAPGDMLSVEIHASEPVDFYLTNASGYYIYESSALGTAFDFQFIGGECSRVDATEISYTYNPLVEDTLVIIADNANRTSGGASPVGQAAVTGKIIVREKFWSLNNLLIIGGALAAVALVVWFAASRWRRAPREEAGPRMVRVLRRVRKARRPAAGQRKVLSRKKRYGGR